MRGIDDLVLEVVIAQALEWLPVGAQLVEYAAEGPNVGLGREGIASADLRGHVEERAHALVHVRVVLRQELARPEIADLHRVLATL